MSTQPGTTAVQLYQMPIPAPPVVQASSDDQLIGLWLHGRAEHTQRGYTLDVRRFRAFTGKPLGLVTLGDLQGFADSLGHLAPSSRARSLGAIKRLYTF